MDGVREGLGLLYCLRNDGDQCLFECEWRQSVPIKGKRVLIYEDEWHYYEGQFDEDLLMAGTGRWEGDGGYTY